MKTTKLIWLSDWTFCWVSDMGIVVRRWYYISKRQDTLSLENALIKSTKQKRIYGCEEITIGFNNNGHGNEVVDFMTMDSKGIIKCYELKVTLQDLKSDAKKSWYGHYNYLVVSRELYNKVADWDEYIKEHIGIIVGEYLESKRKAKRCEVSTETEIMLKESMIRSMFWKMQKYKDAQSIEKQKQLQSKIRNLERENENIRERALKSERIINEYETYKWYNDGVDADLAALAKAEKEKYRENRRR